MKNAMQKAIEMKKWNLEKKEQKVTLFLANSLRKTQKEQELDRKILETKAKLGKVVGILLLLFRLVTFEKLFFFQELGFELIHFISIIVIFI